MTSVVSQVTTIWDAVSGLSGVASAFAGTLSVIVAWKTVDISRQASAEQGAVAERLARLSVEGSRNTAREQTANSTYDSYLRLCVQYPDLAAYATAAYVHGFKNPREVWDLGSVNSERYLWFLSFALNAFERILVDAEGSLDEYWVAAIEAQISYHEPILRVLWRPARPSDYSSFRDHYSMQLSQAVNRVLDQDTAEVAA